MENNKRLSKATSNRHLPEDLWPEILSNLPVKSLVRFRCVSKSWLSIIKDTDFRHLHMKKFKNNRDETRLLVVQGTFYEQNCVLRSSDTFRIKSESLHTFGKHTAQGEWKVECSIDGLVLLKSHRRNRFEDLRVWNPSIKKFHDIPSLREIDEIPYGVREANVGIGYDPSIKDYKLVKLIFVKSNIVHSVAIYTLGADSWKIIPYQGKGLSDWHWMRIFETKAVYLRGSLYFIGKDRKREVMELVSVDLSSEVFSCTSLPSQGLSWSLGLVDDGCALALFDHWGVTMWVSGSESGPMHWKKRYSSNFYIPKLLYHKKNGDILIWWDHREMSYADESGRLCDMVISYNLETKTRKILMKTEGLESNIYNVCGYVESLIMV